MRTLLLLRHAKSSWDDPDLSDHERPLNKRGTTDAPRIGGWMRDNGLMPEAVLCSGAVRARATLALVLADLKGTAPAITYDESLYLAEPEAILDRIRKVPADVGTLLVVGHNPGLQMLALSLAGGGDRKALAALAEKLPTAGLAVLELDGASWTPIAYGGCRLRSFVTPKRLG